MEQGAPTSLRVDDLWLAQRQLRVAFVTEDEEVAEGPSQAGGVELALALQERGHAVRLIRPANSPVGSEPTFNDALRLGLPLHHNWKIRGQPAQRLSLVKLWTFQRPDVVHLATTGQLAWSALEAAQRLHLSVTAGLVADLSAMQRLYGPPWSRHPLLMYLRKLHNQCACTVAANDRARQDALQAGLLRVRVLHDGIAGANVAVRQLARGMEDLFSELSAPASKRVSSEADAQEVLSDWNVPKASGIRDAPVSRFS